jgi:hypothetical protein
MIKCIVLCIHPVDRGEHGSFEAVRQALGGHSRMSQLSAGPASQLSSAGASGGRPLLSDWSEGTQKIADCIDLPEGLSEQQLKPQVSRCFTGGSTDCTLVIHRTPAVKSFLDEAVN